MLGLERLRQRFTPRPEEAPDTGKPGMRKSEDEAAVAGEFKARASSPAESAPLGLDDKVVVKKQRPDLKIVPLDETADWIQQTAAQPETKQAGKQVFVKAEARAREKQLEQLVGTPKELVQKARAQKQEFAERDKTHTMVREHQAAPPPEQALGGLVTQMTRLNIQRAELEAAVDGTDRVVDDTIVALGRAGTFNETVAALRRAMQDKIKAKKQVATIDQSIQAVGVQMSEIIDYAQPNRAQELKKTASQTAEILAGTKMDPRDRTKIEQWFVDPQKEFDKDVYEALRPNASPEDLAALKSNTVPAEMRVVFNREWDEDLRNRTKLEQKRDLLEQDGRERFKKVLGSEFGIENLRTDKSLWGRLLLKARLGKLRGEFADWEQSYDEVSNRIDTLNAKIVQDELWLKNPHQAGVNDVERITGKVLSRQMRTTESLGKGHLST